MKTKQGQVKREGGITRIKKKEMGGGIESLGCHLIIIIIVITELLDILRVVCT